MRTRRRARFSLHRHAQAEACATVCCHLVLALLVALGLLPVGHAAATLGGEDLIAIRPESKTVAAGETFSVQVTIEGPAPVVASDIQIRFDTSYLECLSVVHSGIFDAYFIDNSDLAAGKIWFGGGTFGTRAPPFVYVTLTFKAKNRPGTTRLAFNPDEVYLEGEQGSVLGGLVEGAVIISAPGSVLYLPLIAR